MEKKIDYSLYLVTDDPSRYEGDWLENVRAAVEGGVTCVQYRDTESSARTAYERILKLRDALNGRAPVIVNNDIALAEASRAEGVHLGQDDLMTEIARRILGPSVEVGLSITDIRQLNDLDRNSVDCIGIGPVYDATKTKSDAAAAMGTARLAEIIASANGLSNCAIGGITLANAADVIATGVGGLAVVSAFSKSSDPFETARSFRAIIDRDCALRPLPPPRPSGCS